MVVGLISQSRETGTSKHDDKRFSTSTEQSTYTILSLVQEHVQPGIIDLAEHGSVEESATVILPLMSAGSTIRGLSSGVLWQGLVV